MPTVIRYTNEVIEVIDRIVDFTVPPHQIRRVWRHQSLRITARLGEDRETPGACMAHYPTDHRRGGAGNASAGGTSGRGGHQGGRNNCGPVRTNQKNVVDFKRGQQSCDAVQPYRTSSYKSLCQNGFANSKKQNTPSVASRNMQKL